MDSQESWNACISAGMKDPAGKDSPVAQRLRKLRALLGYERQEDFAAFLGITHKRYANYENGFPVPQQMAYLMRRKIPGLSTGWIYDGVDGDLSVSMRDRLRDAVPAVDGRRKRQDRA